MSQETGAWKSVTIEERRTVLDLAQQFSESDECDYPDGFAVLRSRSESYAFTSDGAEIELYTFASEMWRCVVNLKGRDGSVVGVIDATAGTAVNALVDAVVAALLGGTVSIVAAGEPNDDVRDILTPWLKGLASAEAAAS